MISIIPACRCTPFKESFPGEAELMEDIVSEREEFEKRNAPTYTPDLHPYRLLWRLYGRFIYRPLVRWWGWYAHCCFVKRKEHWNGGQWERRFWTADIVKEWISRSRWLPRTIRNLVWSGGYDCPVCGDENFHDGTNDSNDNGRPLFECVDDGRGSNPEWGTYYWWEGWLWCYYCGHHEWVSEDSA